LRGPLEAIPDDEIAKSIAAIELLASRFREDCAEIAALFDALGLILRAEAERPDSLQ